jgi:hypothetical protein
MRSTSTRIGREAIRNLVQYNHEIQECLNRCVAPAQRPDAACMAAFYADAAPLVRKLVWRGGDELEALGTEADLLSHRRASARCSKCSKRTFSTSTKFGLTSFARNGADLAALNTGQSANASSGSASALNCGHRCGMMLVMTTSASSIRLDAMIMLSSMRYTLGPLSETGGDPAHDTSDAPSDNPQQRQGNEDKPPSHAA